MKGHAHVTSAPLAVNGQSHAPAALLPWKETPIAMNRGLCDSQQPVLVRIKYVT